MPGSTKKDAQDKIKNFLNTATDEEILQKIQLIDRKLEKMYSEDSRENLIVKTFLGGDASILESIKNTAESRGFTLLLTNAHHEIITESYAANQEKYDSSFSLIANNFKRLDVGESYSAGRERYAAENSVGTTQHPDDEVLAGSGGAGGGGAAADTSQASSATTESQSDTPSTSPNTTEQGHAAVETSHDSKEATHG